MLVIPRKTIGGKGGRANGKGQTSTRGILSAAQEAFARCLTLHGMSGLDSYRAAYRNKMSDKAATNEAYKLKHSPLIVARIRELQALLVEVDLHDRAETDAFVLAGLKRLALNGDNSAAQLGAYKLIGSLTHTRMFDPPVIGTAPDNRTADTIRKTLQRRVERLLPAPADADGSLAPGDDDSEVGEVDGVAGEASG